MELHFESLSCSKKKAAYSGFILSGNIVLKAEDGATIDGKGISIELVGHEITKNKITGAETVAEIFQDRYPRCILLLKEDGYFQDVKIPLEPTTKMVFEILIPAGIGSSFRKEYKTHEVRVQYLLRASSRVNNSIVQKETPVFISKYPFATIDWFQTSPTELHKEIRAKQKRTEETTSCFCMTKSIEVEDNVDVKIAMEYIPSVRVGDQVECAVKFSSTEFKKPGGKLQLRLSEILKIEGEEGEIEVEVDRKEIEKVEKEMQFKFDMKEFDRYDFNYEGILFRRKYGFVLSYKDDIADFRIEGDLHILSPNNFSIAKNISEGSLMERNAFDLLEEVSYVDDKV